MDRSSAVLINCNTLQNHYHSSFSATRMIIVIIHSILGKNSHTICVTEGRRKRLQLSNKIFINLTKTEKHC